MPGTVTLQEERRKSRRATPPKDGSHQKHISSGAYVGQGGKKMTSTRLGSGRSKPPKIC